MAKIFILMLLFVSVQQSFADEEKRYQVAYGGQDQGGGKTEEMEFRRRGLEVLTALTDSHLMDEELGFKLSEFREAVNSVDVIGVYCSPERRDPRAQELAERCQNSSMNLNGRQKDALNSLKNKKIWFELEKWESKDLDSKRLLAIREYLRFTHRPDGRILSDDIYDTSVQTYLKLTKRGYFTLDNRATLERMVQGLEIKSIQDKELRQLTIEQLIQVARCTDILLYANALKGTKLEQNNLELYKSCVVMAKNLDREIARRQKELGIRR